MCDLKMTIFFNGGTIFFCCYQLNLLSHLTQVVPYVLHTTQTKRQTRVASAAVKSVAYFTPWVNRRMSKFLFFFYLFFTSYEAEKTTRGWQKIVQNIKMILGNEDTAFFFFFFLFDINGDPPGSFSLWHALINTDCSKTLLNTVLVR